MSVFWIHFKGNESLEDTSDLIVITLTEILLVTGIVQVLHSLYLGQNIKLSLSLFISNTAIHIFWWQFYLRISCIKLAQSVHHLAVTFGLEGNNIEGRNSNERKIPSSIVTHNGLVISWNNSHQLAVYLYCSRLTGFFQGPRHMTQPKRLSFFLQD